MYRLLIARPCALMNRPAFQQFTPSLTRQANFSFIGGSARRAMSEHLHRHPTAAERDGKAQVRRLEAEAAASLDPKSSLENDGDSLLDFLETPAITGEQTSEAISRDSKTTAPPSPLLFAANTAHSMKSAKQLMQEKQHNSPLLHRFVRITARDSDFVPEMHRQLTRALLQLQRRTNQNPAHLFQLAIGHLQPVVECGSYKRGAKMIRVPLPMVQYRAENTAMRWLCAKLRTKRRPAVPWEDRYIFYLFLFIV